MKTTKCFQSSNTFVVEFYNKKRKAKTNHAFLTQKMNGFLICVEGITPRSAHNECAKGK